MYASFNSSVGLGNEQTKDQAERNNILSHNKNSTLPLITSKVSTKFNKYIS